MNKSFFKKLHIAVKRVVCLTLCLTLPITCIARVTNANADESKKKVAYEWTRIVKQSDLDNYKESGKSYRILITYDDKYYLSGMQEMNYKNDGDYKATALNGNIKVKLDSFTTRKPYGTLYATYYGWDSDNECHKYTLNFSNDDYYNTKSDYKWLYHENMWLPCIFTYFFVNEKNLNDNFDRDGSHFWCVKSWREEDISFEFADHHSDFFDQVIDGTVQTGKEITDKQFKTIQYMYENRRHLTYSVAETILYAMATWGASLADLYTDYTFEELCEICSKNLDSKEYASELYTVDKNAIKEQVKKEHIGASDKDIETMVDKEYKNKLTTLESTWKKYKEMYIKWLDRDKADTLEGQVKLLYNLSGRCDAAWRHDGNRVYASSLETGSAASFKIFMGKEVTLPTLTENLTIEDGLTYILEDYDVARGVKMVVPKGSTLIIRGAVNNFGSLEVYGKVIIESGSILTGDAEDKAKVKTNGIVAGTVNVYYGGLFYVEEGAGHAESNYGDITVYGTYLCDGILLSNGNVVIDGGQFEVGPNGEAAINAYPNDNKALGTEVMEFLKTNALVDYVKVPSGNKDSVFVLEDGSDVKIYGHINFFHVGSYSITPKISTKGKGVYIDTMVGSINRLSNACPNVIYYERAASLASTQK